MVSEAFVLSKFLQVFSSGETFLYGFISFLHFFHSIFMLYIYFSPVFVLSLWNKFLIGCFSARVHMLFTGFSKLKIWAEYKFQFCHDCHIAKCTKTITTNVVKTKIDATKITALQRKHLTNKSHLKLQIFLWVYFLNSYNCRVRCVYHHTKIQNCSWSLI